MSYVSPHAPSYPVRSVIHVGHYKRLPSPQGPVWVCTYVTLHKSN